MNQKTKTKHEYLCSSAISSQSFSITRDIWNHLPVQSHAHLLAHLVSEAFLSVAQVLPVLLSHFVCPVRTVRIAMMMALFLGSVLAVALPPFGLVFPPHELIKLVVVSLPFSLLVLAAVILISLPAAVLISLLFVALSLTSAGQMYIETCITAKLVVTQRSISGSSLKPIKYQNKINKRFVQANNIKLTDI